MQFSILFWMNKVFTPEVPKLAEIIVNTCKPTKIIMYSHNRFYKISTVSLQNPLSDNATQIENSSLAVAVRQQIPVP